MRVVGGSLLRSRQKAAKVAKQAWPSAWLRSRQKAAAAHVCWVGHVRDAGRQPPRPRHSGWSAWLRSRHKAAAAD